MTILAFLTTTLVLHHLVTISRGYRAIGGEFLIIPLFYAVRYLIQELRIELRILREEIRCQKD